MSIQYKPVLWDRAKLVYDVVLVAAILVYLYLFLRVAPQYLDFDRNIDIQIQRMRAFGTCAFLMLSFVLCIGPLARLDRRFLPLLYNRRHFGVLTCAVAVAHGIFVLDWYFNFSPIPRYAASLVSNQSYGQLLGFPFEAFGMLALAILIVLAVTSHDFWLKFLTPPVWKAMHMSVYVAYAAVVAHVALGALQDARNPVFPALAGGIALIVAMLHVIAAARDPVGEAKRDRASGASPNDWAPAGAAAGISDQRARIISLPGGERVAVFRRGRAFFAISNVCAHQNGPLGEGRLIDGCVTCPWHGYQFRPEDGRSPAPFDDAVPVYRCRIEDGQLFVEPTPQPLGTVVAPAVLADG